MCSRKTSKDTRSATSSPGLESGARPSDSQDGPMTDLFGQPLVPAKTSALPAKDKAQWAREIYGPIATGSSASVALSSSLANRLKTLSASVGSTVYAQTWKRKRTPLGRVYWAHIARARTTSGSDCSGWASPNQRDYKGEPSAAWAGQKSLPRDAQTAGWTTPRHSDEQNDRMGNEAKERELVRPNRGAQLALDAYVAGWPTYSANEDAAGTEKGKMQKMLSHVALTCGSEANGTTAATANSDAFRLNPGFSLWLMLGPTRAIAWLRCVERAMQSISERRRRS